MRWRPVSRPPINGTPTPEDILRQHPDDPVVRLMASDYLEEQGQQERAETLRLRSADLTLEQALLWIEEGTIDA